MRKLIFFLLASFFCSSVYAQQKFSVLFLGNSYTGVNNLPQTVHDLALSLGDTLDFDSYTPGGYTFNAHSTDANSINKIKAKAWDFVVLQEQSQLPSFPPSQVASQCYPYAHKLDSVIEANSSCSETMFYMTWGRKNGDATNCTGYPPVCTYVGMQARLRTSYLEMGLNEQSSVAPVGAAWKTMRDSFPAIDLYQPDESHPSENGTYLAACVFYSSIFHKRTAGSTYLLGAVTAADAQKIQHISDKVVLDSLENWQQYGSVPFANFSHLTTGNSVQFTNLSMRASNYNWNFGDSQTSSSTNPNHTYSAAGQYVVRLSAGNGCKNYTVSDTLTILPLGLSESVNITSFNLHPNPARQKVYLQTNLNHGEMYEVYIYDPSGRLLHKSAHYEQLVGLPIDQLPKGMYQVVIHHSQRSSILKLVIE